MSNNVWDGVREWTYAELAENEQHLRFLIDDHSPDTNSGKTFCPICDRRAPCETVELAATGLAALEDRAAQAARIAELEAENERLRAALVHRCVVKDYDQQCEDCQEIAALLDDTTPALAPGEGTEGRD